MPETKTSDVIQRDEHGCVVGKERYDEEKGECVPIPQEKPTGDFVPLTDKRTLRRR